MNQAERRLHHDNGAYQKTYEGSEFQYFPPAVSIIQAYLQDYGAQGVDLQSVKVTYHKSSVNGKYLGQKAELRVNNPEMSEKVIRALSRLGFVFLGVDPGIPAIHYFKADRPPEEKIIHTPAIVANADDSPWETTF